MPLSILQQLSLAPTISPGTRNILRSFLLALGQIYLDMCIDRAAVYYEEKFDQHVAIRQSNYSTMTIREIKCQLVHVSLFSFVGERRTPFFLL